MTVPICATTPAADPRLGLERASLDKAEESKLMAEVDYSRLEGSGPE